MATSTESKTAGKARMRYLRSSPQKVRLVVDLVRGKPAEQALNILRFAKKAVARDLYKLLYSAMSNAREKGADERTLFVERAFVDPGPSLKRIRANSMGRAFHVLHRTSHVTFQLGAREVRKTAAGGGSRARSASKSRSSGKPATAGAKS